MTAQPVLRRKIARPAPPARRSALSPALLGALCARLARHLAKAHDAAAFAEVGDVGLRPLGELLDGFEAPETAAILTFEGAGGEALLRLDPALLHHLTDLALGAAPEAEETVPARPLTALDLAFYRRFTSTFGEALAETVRAEIGGPLSAVACREVARERANLRIGDETTEMLTARIDVSIGRAGRAGSLDLAVPRTLADALVAEGDAGTPAPAEGRWAGAMEGAALDAEMPLLAAIHVTKRSLAELSRLEVGDVMRLPPGAALSVPLLHADRETRLARGKLGVVAGRRALRIEG